MTINPNPIAHKEQPAPIKNEYPAIADLVIEDMLKRKEIGIQRYKVALQPHNGRNAMRDLFEEILDAAVYCKQEILQQKNELLWLNLIHSTVSGRQHLDQKECVLITNLVERILKNKQ